MRTITPNVPAKASVPALDLMVLPVEKRKKTRAMMKIYRDIDRQADDFRRKTGLNCPAGCGECCHNKHVTATTIEMLPLAAYLHNTGGLDVWMAKVDRGDEQSPCIFYQGTGKHGQGFCRVYAFRPLVCRLFGFCARENKRKNYELLVCAKIRKNSPVEMSRAQTAADAGRRDAPVSPHYVMKTFALSLEMGGDAQNINHAFFNAAAILQLHARLPEK